MISEQDYKKNIDFYLNMAHEMVKNSDYFKVSNADDYFLSYNGTIGDVYYVFILNDHKSKYKNNSIWLGEERKNGSVQYLFNVDAINKIFYLLGYYEQK
jgi:hypothetical protein